MSLSPYLLYIFGGGGQINGICLSLGGGGGLQKHLSSIYSASFPPVWAFPQLLLKTKSFKEIILYKICEHDA